MEYSQRHQSLIQEKRNTVVMMYKKNKIVAQYAQSQHGIFTKPLKPNTRTNKCSHHGVSKNTRDYYAICTKLGEPHIRTN